MLQFYRYCFLFPLIHSVPFIEMLFYLFIKNKGQEIKLEGKKRSEEER